MHAGDEANMPEPSSRLFPNTMDGIEFVSVSEHKASSLGRLGVVLDAKWSP
jgi:hypothetical protein